MDTEPLRGALASSALGGGLVWGAFTLVTAVWAGQPVTRADLIKAIANVFAGIFVGVLVAYFLGPVIQDYLPTGPIRDPHVVGFLIGTLSWEAIPFALLFAKSWAGRLIKEKS